MVNHESDDEEVEAILPRRLIVILKLNDRHIKSFKRRKSLANIVKGIWPPGSLAMRSTSLNLSVHPTGVPAEDDTSDFLDDDVDGDEEFEEEEAAPDKLDLGIDGSSKLQGGKVATGLRDGGDEDAWVKA